MHSHLSRPKLNALTNNYMYSYICVLLKFDNKQLEWKQEVQLLAATSVIMFSFVKTTELILNWHRYVYKLSGGTYVKYNEQDPIEDIILTLGLAA